MNKNHTLLLLIIVTALNCFGTKRKIKIIGYNNIGSYYNINKNNFDGKYMTSIQGTSYEDYYEEKTTVTDVTTGESSTKVKRTFYTPPKSKTCSRQRKTAIHKSTSDTINHSTTNISDKHDIKFNYLYFTLAGTIALSILSFIYYHLYNKSSSDDSVS